MRPTVPVEGVGATFVNGKLVERPEDETAEAVQPEAAQKILMHEVLTITLSWRAPVVRIEGTGPIGHSHGHRAHPGVKQILPPAPHIRFADLTDRPGVKAAPLRSAAPGVSASLWPWRPRSAHAGPAQRIS